MSSLTVHADFDEGGTEMKTGEEDGRRDRVGMESRGQGKGRGEGGEAEDAWAFVLTPVGWAVHPLLTVASAGRC